MEKEKGVRVSASHRFCDTNGHFHVPPSKNNLGRVLSSKSTLPEINVPISVALPLRVGGGGGEAVTALVIRVPVVPAHPDERHVVAGE